MCTTGSGKDRVPAPSSSSRAKVSGTCQLLTDWETGQGGAREVRVNSPPSAPGNKLRRLQTKFLGCNCATDRGGGPGKGHPSPLPSPLPHRIWLKPHPTLKPPAQPILSLSQVSLNQPSGEKDPGLGELGTLRTSRSARDNLSESSG